MKQVNYGGNMKSSVFDAFNQIEIAEYRKNCAKLDFVAGQISEEQYKACVAEIKEDHKDDWKQFKNALTESVQTSYGLPVEINAVDILNRAIESKKITVETASYVMAIVTGKEDATKYCEAFLIWLDHSVGAKVRSGFTVKKDKKAGTVNIIIRDSLVISSLKGKGARIIHGLIHDALFQASLKTDKVKMTFDGWTLPDAMIK